MDRELRDRRIVVAWMVHGAELERSADDIARRITPGLNTRDVLLLASLVYDRGGRALPSEMIGPVHTTAAGVTGSLRRLEAAQLVERTVGEDARTRPVTLTPTGSQLIVDIVDTWQQWFEGALRPLADDDRTRMYELMAKASDAWQGVWPEHFVEGPGRPPIEGLEEVHGLLLDIDGVLCRGDEAIAGAADAVRRFQEAGIELLVLTNNTRLRSNEHASRFATLGMDIAAERILTAGQATAEYLVDLDPGATVFVAGSTALEAEVREAGLREANQPEYVVAGIDLDMRLSRLAEAAAHLNAGAHLIACNPDRTLPVPGGTSPETGALIAFLEAASDSTATVVGKPNSGIFETALSRIGLDRDSVMMVGDTLETDILGANAAGIRSAHIGDGLGFVADNFGGATVLVADLAELADRLLG